MGKPYSSTALVLNRALLNLATQAQWNLTDPGTVALADITYTALAAVLLSPVTVSYKSGGVAGAETVAVSGREITITIASGVSTATQVLAAFNGSAAATALASAAITGTAGTAQVATTSAKLIAGDVVLRIAEADREIEQRLAGLGLAGYLPFAAGANPPVLQDFSALYARYACLRDLYTAGTPSAGTKARDLELRRFEDKWELMKTGWALILDQNSAALAGDKFTPATQEYPDAAAQARSRDLYPNFPSGPYADPPAIES